MAETPDYSHQATFSFGSLMVNVRGRSAEEFEANLKSTEQLSSLIDQTGEALAVKSKKPPANEEEAMQNLRDGGLNPQIISRECAHGQMKYKEGISKAGNAYKMWACPVKDGCDPIWVR